MAVAPLDVLCCRITIGDPDAGNPMSILNPITLTEVQEVEIVETYKKLIGTATIRFPKGTISAPPSSVRPPLKAKTPAG